MLLELGHLGGNHFGKPKSLLGGSACKPWSWTAASCVSDGSGSRSIIKGSCITQIAKVDATVSLLNKPRLNLVPSNLHCTTSTMLSLKRWELDEMVVGPRHIQM